MTKSDYDGAIDAAKKGVKLGKIIYKAIANPLPNDLEKLKEIEKNLRQWELDRIKIEQTKENIKRMRKEQFRAAKLRRRAKIKKFFGIKGSVTLMGHRKSVTHRDMVGNALKSIRISSKNGDEIQTQRYE